MLIDKLYFIILAANFDKNWWPEILKTVSYFCNLSPSLVTEKTPYKGWYGNKSNLSHLHIIRCTPLAKKEEVGRCKLINIKAICCKFLGYNEHIIYWLFIEDEQIFWSNKVIFYKLPTWQILYSNILEQANV